MLRLLRIKQFTEQSNLLLNSAQLVEERGLFALHEWFFIAAQEVLNIFTNQSIPLNLHLCFHFCLQVCFEVYFFWSIIFPSQKIFERSKILVQIHNLFDIVIDVRLSRHRSNRLVEIRHFEIKRRLGLLFRARHG